MKRLWYQFTFAGASLCLASCGTPEAVHVSSLNALPAQDKFVAEYAGRDEMHFWSLSGGREFVWDLPIDPTLGRVQSNGPHRLGWSSGAQKFFLATTTSAYLISTDGVPNQLDLHMPGTQIPLDSMHTFAISADGGFVAYYLTARDPGETQPDGLMYQSTEGAIPTTILRGTVPFATTWSPEGKRIALASGEGKLLILDLSGNLLQSMPVRSGNKNAAGEPFDSIHDVQWQPNGESIALTDNDQLYVVNADGSNLHKVPFQSPVSLNSFAWSPDGRRFAFRAVTDKSCHFELNTSSFRQCTVESSLFTSNSDGSALTKIRGTHVDSKDSPNWESTIFWIK